MTVTGNPVLEAARRLGPEISSRSDEIETLGTPPLDLIDAIRPSGAFRQYVPDDMGGPGVTAGQSLEAIEEFAYHDGAIGWCVAISSTTSLLASYLPEPYAHQLFADPNHIFGGFAAPVGRATVVDGGLEVTGRWQWGSGTRHATWIGGGCLVVDADGQPSAGPDGLAAPFVFFDRADIDFIDNWDVSGLCGTGSGDYQVTKAFVPEGRWAQIGLDAPQRDNPFAHFSFFGLLAAAVSAAALGIARRSIDELVALAADKRPQGSRRPLAERAPIQADTAIAEAKLQSARSFLRETTECQWERAAEGHEPNLADRGRLRLAATHATQTAGEVAELMYKAGGGAAVYKTSPLQRGFRDAMVATQHAMVAPRTYEVAGRIRLGLETNSFGL